MCICLCKCFEKIFTGRCCGGSKEPVDVFKNNRQRSCTDVLWMILYIASFVGVAICVSTAANAGARPARIYKGVDYLGRVCGMDAGVEDLEYAMWPSLQYPDIKVCVSSCEATKQIPTNLPAYFDYSSSNLFGYCIPALDQIIDTYRSIAQAAMDNFETASQMASNAIGDLYTTWAVILASAGIALIVTFLYATLSKYFAKFLVFSLFVVIVAGGCILSYVFFDRAAVARDSDMPERRKAMMGLGYVTAICTGIIVLLFIALRKRILLAIQIVKEAGMALADLPTVIIFPIFPLLFGLGFFVVFIVTCLYIFSVQTVEERPLPSNIQSLPYFQGAVNYTDYVWDDNYKGSFAFVFFQMLWTIQFLVYFVYFVVAGAIAHWYFASWENPETTDRKKRGDGDGELPHSTVMASVWRALRFHLGTIALASLIIAIVQFIRACVKYLEEQMNKADKDSRLRKVLFCLLQGCLYCLQCCLDKVNKNALVWTAIWGDSFVPSVCSSFSLIWSNLLRVASINMISSYLIFMGKIMAALITTAICGLIIRNAYADEDVNSVALPLTVIFLISFLVASMFMVIYETTIDTIFLCFLVDEKINKDAGRMIASKQLLHIINQHQQQSEQEGQKQLKAREDRQKLLEETENQ